MNSENENPIIKTEVLIYSLSLASLLLAFGREVPTSSFTYQEKELNQEELFEILDDLKERDSDGGLSTVIITSCIYSHLTGETVDLDYMASVIQTIDVSEGSKVHNTIISLSGFSEVFKTESQSKYRYVGTLNK